MYEDDAIYDAMRNTEKTWAHICGKTPGKVIRLGRLVWCGCGARPPEDLHCPGDGSHSPHMASTLFLPIGLCAECRAHRLEDVAADVLLDMERLWASQEKEEQKKWEPEPAPTLRAPSGLAFQATTLCCVFLITIFFLAKMWAAGVAMSFIAGIPLGAGLGLATWGSR